LGREAVDFFRVPPACGDLGDQITDAKVMNQCEEYFSKMQQ